MTTIISTGDHETIPLHIQDLYLLSLQELGIDPARMISDSWKTTGKPRPSVPGAWAGGLVDGMEVTQFTYFQQVGGMDVKPVAVEITYGLERLASYLQDVDNVFDIEWVDGSHTGNCSSGRNGSTPSTASKRRTGNCCSRSSTCMKEAKRLVGLNLVLPGYDYVLKCSHTFNLLRRAAQSVLPNAPATLLAYDT